MNDLNNYSRVVTRDVLCFLFSFCWLLVFISFWYCDDLLMQHLELVLPLLKTIWDISMWWSLGRPSHLMKVVLGFDSIIFLPSNTSNIYCFNLYILVMWEKIPLDLGFFFRIRKYLENWPKQLCSTVYGNDSLPQKFRSITFYFSIYGVCLSMRLGECLQSLF